MKQSRSLSAAALQMIAMGTMLLDHIWGVGLARPDWLTCVGRIAFPIYCFLAVEGYFHTGNFHRYLLRMLCFALIAEIPFNLMVTGSWFYPLAQNVMWTLLLGLLGIHLMERARKKGWLVWLAASAAVAAGGWLLGNLAFTDYHGAGVLTVYVFYFFRGRKWWCLAGQLLGMLVIHTHMLKGYYYNIELFGLHLELGRQALALAALPLLWLYRGEQGIRSKSFQYFRYAFYPAHMLLLWLLRTLLTA